MRTFSFQIKSSISELKKIKVFTQKVKKEALLSDNTSHDIFIILSELATNAVIHGNKQDIKKKVFIHCKVFEKKIFLSVKDQGEGFNPLNIPNPLDKHNIFKPSGRGVFLVKKIAEKVSFNFDEKGTIANTVLHHKN